MSFTSSVIVHTHGMAWTLTSCVGGIYFYASAYAGCMLVCGSASINVMHPECPFRPLVKVEVLSWWKLFLPLLISMNSHTRTYTHSGGNCYIWSKTIFAKHSQLCPRYEGAQLLVHLSWRGDLSCLCNTVTQVFITEPLHFPSSPPTHALLFTMFLSPEKLSDCEVLIGCLCFKIHDPLFLFQAASRHVSTVGEMDVPR